MEKNSNWLHIGACKEGIIETKVQYPSGVYLKCSILDLYKKS